MLAVGPGSTGFSLCSDEDTRTTSPTSAGPRSKAKEVPAQVPQGRPENSPARFAVLANRAG